MPPTNTTIADLPRRIGFWGALGLMVGIIVGSGIFRTPTQIAQNMGTPWAILALWVVGGVLALLGALTWAELSVRYPKSGGVYVFLKEGLGAPVAFVFGWTYMLITKPFAAAGIVIIGVENLHRLLGWVDAQGKVGDPQLTTCVVLIALTLLNLPGVRASTAFTFVLTVVKVLAIGSIAVLAVLLQKGSSANFAPIVVTIPFTTAMAAVMSAILWTYDGWSDIGAIAGEVREPRRLLPRIFIWGTLAVTALYVAVNAAYMYMVPLGEMARTDNIAPRVMDILVGSAGGTAVTVLVIISTFGSSNASVLTGARVTYAQAKDGLLFRFLARVHPTWQTPHVSLWFQCVLSCVAVFITRGKFGDLSEGFTFTMWIFYGLGAATIFIFRARRAPGPDDYRCPGYPIVPAIFILCAAAMTVLSIKGNIDAYIETNGKAPLTTLYWLGVLAAGFPVYYLWRAITRGSARAGS